MSDGLALPLKNEEQLFAELLEVPAHARQEFITRHCGEDMLLTARLTALWRGYEEQSAFLDKPAAEKVLNATGVHVGSLAPEPVPGNRIGRYRVIERIGAGGFGVVFLAEQEEPIRRHVALKIIRLGMDTQEFIDRFEAERQVLALMDHPNIARVYDAGATDTGRPFLVMEVVHGVKITDYCDQHNLTIADRINLFAQVCHAVQHAHQKGVIHRDLKPSNILVTLHDGQPLPKIIDFGIAKATQGRLTNATIFTSSERLMGTPTYISPEQAEMSSLDIDTRSDIYSLGVLLYELLTGRTPFEAKELIEAGFDEMRRRIREVEPPRPSSRLRALDHANLTATAQQRRIDALKLIKLLNGDPDWIVMQCLEKDRSRRYETATSLAADLKRHLQNQPVEACPPTPVYRFQKMVRRNRFALTATAAVALALIVGVAPSAWQAIRAERAERTAREEAATAKAVNDFLVSDLLRQADSRAQAAAKIVPNPDLKVRSVLDRAGENVGPRFKDQPYIEAAVRGAIGSAYFGVGDSVKAELHHGRALQLRQRLLGAEHRDTLASMNGLAFAQLGQGKFAGAAELWTRMLHIQKGALGAEHPETLASMDNLAVAYGYLGWYVNAEKLHARAVEIRGRVLGADHPDTLTSMTNLAADYLAQGRIAEAAALHAKTLEIRRRVLGTEHPDTLWSMNLLARSYVSLRKYDEATSLHMQTLEIQKRVLGAEHPDTLSSMHLLGSSYSFQGKYAEAAALHAQTLEIQKRVLGLEHPFTLSSMGLLAYALGAQEKRTESAALYAEIWAIKKSALGPEHLDAVTAMSNLALAESYGGKYAEAAALQAEILEVRKRVLGVEHPDTLASMNNLANAYRFQGKFVEAVALHLEALELGKRVFGIAHRITLKSMADAGSTYLAQGKFDQAVALWTQTWEIQNRILGFDHPDTLASMHSLAYTYEKAKDFPKAQSTYRDFLAASLRKDGFGSINVANAQANLGRILLVQKKFVEAEPFLREALITREKKAPDHWRTFNARTLLGGALAGQKKFVEAEVLLVSGYEGMKVREGTIDADIKPCLNEALELLVQFYTDFGQPEKAIAWKEKLSGDGGSAAPVNASSK